MHKFLISVLVITSFSILYVFQHAKLLEYSYHIDSHQKYMSLLVDQNRSLRYNIAKLETPARLEETVLSQKGVEFYMPAAWHKIKIEEKLSSPRDIIVPARPFTRAGRVISSMFLLDTEAVASDSNE